MLKEKSRSDLLWKKEKEKKEKDENGESLRRLREKEKGDEDESKFFLLRSGLTGY